MQARIVLSTAIVLASALGLAACGKGGSSTDQAGSPPASQPPAYQVVQGSSRGAVKSDNVPDDAAITKQVQDRFSGDKRLAHSTIRVQTKNGVVFLTGKADSEADKTLAGQLASRVANVRVVVNELTLAGN